MIPGVSTATEIMQALDLGLDTVKFFPAEAYGGLATVKALAAAFPQVRFVPTGGITAAERTRLPRPSRRSSPSAAAGWSRPTCWPPGDWDEVAARCAATSPPLGPPTDRPARSPRMIETRPVAECEFDIVALGEVMLRLDPGEGRVRTARRFEAWEGGGEYNVARGMRKVFGLRAGVVTALADNEIGRLVENLIMQGGVDTSLIRWETYDGIGRTVRNGLNFTERGFGVRGAVGVSDRANTAISHLRARGRWTGTTCSAGAACAGCTPAGSTPRCRRTPPPSPRRRWPPRSGTARSSPSTSTTGPACGPASAAPSSPATSTPGWRATST